MSRILITGGAGFIGSHLSETLLADGHDITIIDDLSTGRMENIQHLTENPRFHFAIANISNTTVMDRLVSECDTIYHLAAAVGVDLIVSQPIHTIKTNVHGTEVVLETARRYRKKVLIASTSEVYGKSNNEKFNENDDSVIGPTIKNRWSYAVSKALDEFLALAYHKESDLPVVVFRLFNTVGPRQTGRYGMVIPRFVKAALEGEPIRVFGDGKQLRCFCNVSDAIRGIIGLTEHKEAIGQVFNIGSTEEISIIDLAERVKTRTGSKSEIALIPYDQAYEEGFEDMRRRMPDTSKIRSLTGWEPQKLLDQTLDEVITYFRQHE
jgi:UDP-glucose 4-epimerase